jgi:predicted LPLAT superfamily acyltransferase
VTAWTRQRERGSLAALRLMTRLVLALGWRVGYALLHPITAYFVLTAPAAQRRAVRAYLARALGRAPSLRDMFRLYFVFACTMLDRVFLLAGRSAGYTVEVVGLERLDARLRAGQGVVLLGAHLGSFEVLRVLAGADCPVEIRPMMYEENARQADALFNALDPARAGSVIALGRPDTMLRAGECLERGGIVGLLGDRAPRGERMLRVPFLGVAAPFPAGPHLLAHVLGAPVMLFFGLWCGPRRYELRFEPFAERISLDRAERPAALAEWAARYAARLEALCRAHPYNWFNFYDFWEEFEDPPSSPSAPCSAAEAAAPR